MRYLSNAFSLGMIDFLHHEDGGCSLFYPELSGATLESAKRWLSEADWESCVGHADTAELLTAMLGVPVPMRRVSTSLQFDDEILVAQYNGPRLPEGTRTLPEGAKIRWYLIRLIPVDEVPHY